MNFIFSISLHTFILLLYLNFLKSISWRMLIPQCNFSFNIMVLEFILICFVYHLNSAYDLLWNIYFIHPFSYCTKVFTTFAFTNIPIIIPLCVGFRQVSKNFFRVFTQRWICGFIIFQYYKLPVFLPQKTYKFWISPLSFKHISNA